MQQRDADIIGMNCGTGVDMGNAAEIVRGFRARTTLRLIAQPNAGRPELVGGRTVYHETPDEMAAAVPALLDAGVRIVGSCCGSTPAHTRAIREKADQYLARRSRLAPS
jgi:5-methyltetrahydrofolate--homocysteine methyltransferase